MAPTFLYGSIVAGQYCTLFIETSIALCFVAELHRWVKLETILQHTLLWVWPLSAACGVADICISGSLRYSDAPTKRRCIQPRCDYVFLVICLISVITSSVAYISTFAITLLSSRWPSSVGRRITTRAGNYCLAGVVSVVGGVGMYCDGKDFQVTDPKDLVVYVFFAANGFLNFLAYSCQSRHLRSTARGLHDHKQVTNEASRPGRDTSWHVGFREEPTVVEIPGSLRSSLHSSIIPGAGTSMDQFTTQYLASGSLGSLRSSQIESMDGAAPPGDALRDTSASVYTFFQ